MTSCPVCRATIPAGPVAGACPACGTRLPHGGVGRLSGSMPVIHATGEFMVPELPPSASDAAIATDPAGSCSWCGRAGDQVRKLLGTGAVAICDGCVALCVDILDAELGPGWR
ncbi:MAG TPA: ClpX C4-type zinc finger protein [Kofleriaceae bacterium]|nr:ClpX C4-type zinc finger protein [Kofleriaceae bacterium]